MPSKTEEYLALAQRTANGLTRYWESWTDYLTTTSRLYKYPFADQLMIYAQKARNEMQELVRAQKNVERFFAEEKNTTEKTQTRKKSRRGAFPVGRHPRRFFSLYSSFAEQCACYPYIFPTIFPRAAAGRSLHKRLRNLYCAPAT